MLSRSISANEEVIQGLIGVKFRLSTIEENKYAYSMLLELCGTMAADVVFQGWL